MVFSLASEPVQGLPFLHPMITVEGSSSLCDPNEDEVGVDNGWTTVSISKIDPVPNRFE